MIEYVDYREYRKDFLAVLVSVKFGGWNAFRDTLGLGSGIIQKTQRYPSNFKETELEKIKEHLGIDMEVVETYIQKVFEGLENNAQSFSERNLKVRELLDNYNMYDGCELGDTRKNKLLLTSKGLFIRVGFYFFENRGGYMLQANTLGYTKGRKGFTRSKPRQFRLGRDVEVAKEGYRLFLELVDNVGNVEDLPPLLTTLQRRKREKVLTV